MSNATSTPLGIFSDENDKIPSYIIFLIAFYIVILIGGTVGVIIMSRLLFKRKSQSAMAIIFSNLVVLHAVLLFTLPFRISYYVLQKWLFGWLACKLVSIMIYIHMYIAFFFYVAMIVLRLLTFFKKIRKLEFQKKLYIIAVSTAVWIVWILIILPVFLSHYGISDDYNRAQCFQFHRDLAERSMIIVNCFIISIFLGTVSILLLIQVSVLIQLLKKYGFTARQHQEFRAQIKSFFFLLVILVCFTPHHVFRIHYISHTHLYSLNEICLALSTICCLDFLYFSATVGH